jgi:hypothetical protein
LSRRAFVLMEEGARLLDIHMLFFRNPTQDVLNQR